MSLKVFSFLLVVLAAALDPVPPVWKTSPYLRAGSYNLITTPTTFNVTPMVNMPFSSAFNAVPNVGYGMYGYKGQDSLITEEVQINMTSITTSSFSVKIQIRSGTFIYLLSVRYVAIDLEFPHHFNSFDNVNFAVVPRLSGVVETYTNTYNYTEQAMAINSNFTVFTPPFNNTKIVLFLTSFSTRSNSSPSPVVFNLDWSILTDQTYELTVQFGVNNFVQILRFSMLVFDESEILSSGKYQIVSGVLHSSTSQALLWLPSEFMDNFAIGMTNFSSDRAISNICFDWDTTNISGVFYMRKRMADCQTVIQPQYGIVSSYSFSYIYMKTWECPPNYVFDILNNTCYSQPEEEQQAEVQELCTGAECCSQGFCYHEADRRCYYCDMSIKKEACNSFTITIQKGNIITSWGSIQITHQHAEIINVETVGDEISILVAYGQDMVGEIIRLAIDGFKMEVNCSYSLVPLLSYSPEECYSEGLSWSAFRFMEIASFIILFLSLISFKIVGLELFGVFQLGYFGLFAQEFVNIHLSSLAEFRHFNGYNLKFMPESTGRWWTHYHQLGISRYFINNCNIMLLITVVVVVGALLAHFVLGSRTRHSCASVLRDVLKKLSITLVIFNVYNISFSAATHLLDAQQIEEEQAQYRVSIFLIVLAFTLVLANVLLLEFSKWADVGEFKLKFKANPACLVYINTTLCYRIAQAVYISQLWQPDYHSLVPVYICIALIVYCLVNLPFRSAVQNYRAGAVRVAELVTLLNINYFRSMKKHESLAAKARLHQPVLAQVALLLLCLLLSAAVLAYQIWMQVREWRRKQSEVAGEKQVSQAQLSHSRRSNLDAISELR